MMLRLLAPWCVILGVVGYDLSWTVANRNVMHDVEINPIGAFLLHQPNGVTLLVGAKVFGTILALGFVLLLWRWQSLRRLVAVSNFVVAGLHLALLAFLATDIHGYRARKLAADIEAADQARAKIQALRRLENSKAQKPATRTLLTASMQPLRINSFERSRPLGPAKPPSPVVKDTAPQS